jgi:hypothetical protein
MTVSFGSGDGMSALGAVKEVPALGVVGKPPVLGLVKGPLALRVDVDMGRACLAVPDVRSLSGGAGSESSFTACWFLDPAAFCFALFPTAGNRGVDSFFVPVFLVFATMIGSFSWGVMC